VRGNPAGWSSPEVIGSAVAGVALLGAFLRWELRTDEPMLPLALFRSRSFAIGNAATFFVFASLFTDVFFYAQLLQTGLGHDPLEAGLRLMPWTATFITIAPLAGALADRIGSRPLLAGGLTLHAAGMLWLALTAEPGMAYTAMLGPFLLGGAGVSMAIPAAQTAVVTGVAPESLGKAAGANGMLRELGGVFGIAIAVAVFAGAGGYASAPEFVDGFGPAIGVAAGLALLGALVSLALPRRAAAPAPALQALELEEA
jgi:predicted MFS family arabinose efflux permease